MNPIKTRARVSSATIGALAAILFGMTGWADDSEPFLLDTKDPMVKTGGEVSFSYNSSWIGDDSSAEVVISADGTEIKRTTSEGECVWSPTTAGKHTLTYTTYINGVAQDEVYTATVYADWKYTVEDGKATIVDTTQKSGSVTIPTEIDGFPVVGIERDVFAGCHGLFITVPPSFMNEVSHVLDFGDAIAVCIDYPFATGGDASWRNDEGLLLRSGSITNNLSSWLEMTVPGPGKLTYMWKASSEYYEDESEGVYVIYDYGYLSVDNEAMGGLSDENALEGVAIGGHTDWQDVEFDVTGEGEHTLRWTYVKDKYDDEQMIGEDSIWVDQIKFRPYVTLSFDLGGGVGETPRAIYELHESKIILPADAGFTCDNHVFDGWSNGNQKYAAGKAYEMPRTNVTLKAKWIEKRALSFDLGGGSGTAPSMIKNIPGSVITLPDTAGFDRAKYTFTGWNDGERTYAAGASYTFGVNDVVFTAQWRANTISTPVISSRDIANGGVLNTASATISISADSAASVYYTLDGSTPNAASTKYTVPFVADGLGSVTIKAIALRGNYFDSEVATFGFTRRPYSAAECLGVNGFVVVTEGDAPWYRVQGYSAHDGESALRSGTIGEGGSSVIEMTVYGKGTISFWWKSSSHDGNRDRKYDYVSFEVDDLGEQAWLGGEKDWVNVTYAVPDEGEHTLKWIYKKNSDGIIAGNDCAWLDEVVWMKRFYITYANLKWATHQNPLVYNEGMVIKFTAPSTVDGYTFSGWTPSEIVASDTGDKVVTANWEWAPQNAVVDASVTGWKPVTVKADWAKTELEQKFDAGKKASFIAKFGDNLTSAMTKKTGKRDGAGNELLVWHDYVAGTDPTDINSTFKAKIEMKDGKPVISWEPDLNSVGEERDYTVHGKESLSDIWHSPITALDHFFKVDVAMLREGTVMFNVGGGSSVSSISVRVGQPLGELPTPTREGYTFDGWFTAQEVGDVVTPETVVTADMTIYAHWTIKSYTVEFNANGGNGGVSMSYTHGAALDELPIPTREGYTFLGWFTAQEGGDAVTTETVVTADMTVYAHWTIKSYAVVLNANGGNGGVTKSYTYGVTLGELPTPTREGYTFIGWFTAQEDGEAVTSETVVTTDMAIYAHWTIKSYTVEFNANGGNGGVSMSYAHGAALDELPTPTRDGYKFLGWFTAAEGGVAVTPEAVVTVGMTVYARWEPFDGHDKVQLWEGGPYWATTNIGAEKPEDYGYYFWWGDTVGYKRENDKWVASDGSNSDYSFTSGNVPTYNKTISTLQSEGWITAEGVLAPEHDAAKKHWGGDWRMPTKQESDDLNIKCDWTWTTLNGVNGYIVRGKGNYASNSIFLPCPGYGNGTSLNNAGLHGGCWSSDPRWVDYNSWYLDFNYSGYHSTNYYYGRDYGQSVRPLQGFTK